MANLALFVISSTLTQGFYDFNGGGYGSGYDIGFGKGFGYDKSYPSYNDPKKKDCSRVSCYKPACDEYYEELYVPYGECCPKCRPKDNGKGYSDKDKYYQDSYGCDYTKCYEPKCRSNQELYTPKGECCPQCKNKRNINTYGVGFGFDRGLYNGVDTVDVGFNSGVDTLFGQKARKDPKKDSGYDKYDPKFTPTKKDPKYTKKYEPKYDLYSDVNKGFGKGYDVGFKGKKDPKFDIGYDKYDPKYNKKDEPKKYDIYSGIDKNFGKKDPKYDVGYGKKDKKYDAYSGVGKGFGKGYDIGKKDPKYDVYSDFGGGFGKGFGKGFDFGFGKKKLVTITEIVNEDKELSTLATALKLAGLDEALNGEGPFTLFAPTNDAFAALGDVLDTVINDIDLLTDILLYHVLSGAVFSGDLSDGLIAETLLGQEIEFEINGGVFILTTSGGKSEIIDVDIKAKNGVIHKIDMVLVPKIAPAPAPYDGYADDYYKAATVVDIVANDPELSILGKALTAASLIDTLKGPGPFTVFAPTNDAFNSLPDGLLEELLNDIPTLTDILLYHVVPDNIFSDDITDGLSVITAQGDPLKFTIKGYDVFIITTSGGKSQIVDVDNKAKNGVVHKIDVVLVPLHDLADNGGDDDNGDDSIAPLGFNAYMDIHDKGYTDDNGYYSPKLGTITEIVNEDKELSTLATALKLAGLDEALNGEGPFTLFAPTNDAFDALGDVLDTVVNDIDLLTDILLYHVLSGAVFSSDLSDGLIAETLLGQEIEFEINGGVFILTTSGGKSQVIDVDIDAKNGVIHKINLVLVPKLDNGKDYYGNKGYKDRGYKNRGYKNTGSNKFGKGYDKYNPRSFGGGKAVRFGFDKDTSRFDVFGGKIDRNDKKGKRFDKKEFGQVRYKSDTEDDKLIKDDKKFDLPKPKFDPKFDSKSIGGVSKVGKKLDNKFTKKFDPKLDSKSIKGIGLDKKFDLELDPKFDPKFDNKGKKYDPYGYDPKLDPKFDNKGKKSPKHDPYGYDPKYDPKFGAPKTPKFDPYGYDPKYGNVKTDKYDPKYDPKYAGYGNGDNRGYNGKNDYSFDPKGYGKQVKQPKSKAKKDDVFDKDFSSRNKDLMGEYNVFDGFQQNIKKIDNDLFQSPFKTKKDKSKYY